MADLRLNEAAFLKKFLDDPSGELAMRAFFNSLAREHTEKCVRAMLAYDQKEAQENAFFANAYQEGMTRLRQFAKEQLNAAEQ